MADNCHRPDSPMPATNHYTPSKTNDMRIIDDYPALAAYNRSLAGLNQFERARLKTMNRIANVARLKARRAA